MPIVQQYQLIDKGLTILYYVNPQHRISGNPNKSVWIVKPNEEFDCFHFTYKNRWVVVNDAWGFLLNKTNNFVQLGIGQNNEELKIAKFKKNPTKEEWHGYPCNYMTKTQDIPSDTILKMWVDQKYIKKSKMSKIQRQLLCNL